MTNNIYKFEKYPDRHFPVYSSVQKDRELLVTPHFHDDMEFILIRSGKVTVSMGTEKYHCHDSEILYISPHTVHQVTSETPNASLCGFVFHPSLLKPYFAQNDSSIFFTCGNGMIYSRENLYYEELSEVLNNAITIYNNRLSTYRLDMTAHILLMLSVLLRSGAVFNHAKNDRYCRIMPALEYIERNYNQKIQISDLSRLINVCDDHFIRLFKTATFRTPSSYITDVRLHQALRLLSVHQYSISEISDKTGFSNVPYFSRIFKERIGISPSEYAKIYPSASTTFNDGIS